MDKDLVEQRVEVLRQTVVALVRREGPDLSARQLGVFLTCYLEEEAQTVRGLAAKLHVSKPAITRALIVWPSSIWCAGRADPLDRRSVLVQRTATGMAFLRDIKTILAKAGQNGEPAHSRMRRTVTV